MLVPPVESSPPASSLFPPATELPSLGAEGDELLEEIDRALRTLRALREHSELLGDEVVTSLRRTVAQVTGRLSRKELCVVVAGEPGSGKSTFLDAILGDPRVGAARGASKTPTFIRRRATPRFRARLAGGKMEDFARLVPDRQRQMDELLVGEEQSFAKVESRHAAFALKAESAQEAVQRNEQELTQIGKDLHNRREEARLLEAKIGVTEKAARRSDRALAVVATAVPEKLRGSKLGLLGRLQLLFFMLLNWARWKAFAHARRARDKAQDQVAETRLQAEEAARTCVEMEATAAQLQAETWKKRSAANLADEVVDEAEQALARAREKLNARQREFSRYVEERQALFFSEIARLSGPDADKVVELAIDFPADFLPDDVAILDVPGVTAESGQEHAWNLVQEEADGCILVSGLRRGISGPTEKFLERLREVVPHVLLVLSKMDAAYDEAVAKGSADPWEEVEKARRAGTQQFAEQIGRSPETVLSIAVAAQPAIKDPDSEMARRFEVEVRKLFKLLRHERAMILGARAASVLRSCISASSEAEQRAEAAYRDRIAQMEADQVPEPEVFHRKAMADADSDVDEGGRRAVLSSTQTIRARFAELRRKCGDTIRASVHQGQFRTVALRTEQGLAHEVTSVQQEALRAISLEANRVVRELEARVFETMKERYRITEEVVSKRGSSAESELTLAPVAMPKTVGVRAAIARHSRARLALALAGAAILGGVGWLVASRFLHVPHGPYIGVAIGGVLGTLLAFAKTRRSLERRSRALVEAALRKEEQRVLRDVETLEAGARSNIHGALNHSVEDAIIRYGRFIAEPYHAGEQALARERESLGRLRDLEAALERHDERLDELVKAAAAASRGLCQ